eukprot:2313765-Amphidinium_carterae.1
MVFVLDGFNFGRFAHSRVLATVALCFQVLRLKLENGRMMLMTPNVLTHFMDCCVKQRVWKMLFTFTTYNLPQVHHHFDHETDLPNKEYDKL